MNTRQAKPDFFSRSGLPKPLAWGYLGIIIFMMGDGVEQGWLSPYLIEHGLSMQQSALLFTVYGITIAISSWFSGVLAEGYEIGRAHVCTPVTNAHLVCRLLLAKKKLQQ